MKYTKEKISTHQKISNETLTDFSLELGIDDGDLKMNIMTMRLSGYIYSRIADERDLHYTFDRPTFFDWLFKRKRKAVFKFQAKDLLLNPPKNKDVRIYEIKEK